MTRAVNARFRRRTAVLLTAAVAATMCVSPLAHASAGRGKIRVTVTKANGKRDRAAEGYQICRAKKRNASGEKDQRGCVPVRRGRAVLKKVPPRRWFLFVVGPLGQGPCYSKKGDGFTPKSCSRVRVRAGHTTRVRWHVPTFG